MGTPIYPELIADDLFDKRCEDLRIGLLDDAIAIAKYMFVEGTKHVENDPLSLLEGETTWTEVKNNYFSVCFYRNGEGSLRIDGATNFVIRFINSAYPFDEDTRCIDVFNTHIVICNEVHCVPITVINIQDLNINDIDDGYMFQMETTHPEFPFTVDQFKNIVSLAKTLNDDIESLTI